MMTNEKTVLIQKMEKQRFLPISEETLSLYETYRSCIDQYDPDELSYHLFYQGEYFFRVGNFNQALNFLNRCLQAPKSNALHYLDVRSYNIIGLIYGYLAQESIAINYLNLAKSMSQTLSLDRETAACCINLGHIYSQLDIRDTALSYFKEALTYADHTSRDNYNLQVLCLASCGILYCKNKQYDKALNMSERITASMQENDHVFYDASVLALNILLYDVTQDKDALDADLNKLLTLNSSYIDFIEMSEFYFDVCAYLLAQNMSAECEAILDCIEAYTNASPLYFLKYEYLQLRTAYAKNFASEGDYLSACSQLITLRPDYLKEQNYAKLYCLAYIERLHQAKNDSELFREKSRIDQMTGLLNKYTIQFLVEENLAKSSGKRPSAMILIDLDHFKQINDTLGHLVGDSFISQTASIIQNYFKDHALCGRVGGDEFLVYLSDASEPDSIALQAEILRQEIYRQTSERNITITTQASIGIAFSSERCADYESLFAAADGALYRAKMEGRNKVIVAS